MVWLLHLNHIEIGSRQTTDQVEQATEMETHNETLKKEDIKKA